ncbi:vWA domain-containing protein [Mucilaginibacter sp.]|jgi:Ca-activated chloride channel family protein|uniref:vWA domain-containing protein n=1 Tax=Mucilaginibacter sp. TaxID=1882438 RepID=UPI002C07EDE4|nr:von Willebrand factor type A domain-containing protein [Mucilaginibacter sp.]HTI57598.1 von Willebrand factor type A domain-containing protein [Mucilaginibacter sp.]
MKKLILIPLIIAAFAAFKCNAVRHIHGKVLGSDDKLPIPGATVTIKGTGIGTQTNSAGGYTIDVADDHANLVFSFVGYQSKTVAIGKSDSLDVYLKPSNTSLNEVVVVGYGIQHKKSLAGSVATIPAQANADVAIAPAPVRLQGQVSGVTVTSQNPPKVADMSVYKYSTNNANAKARTNNPGFYTGNTDDESYKTINENGFTNAKDVPLSTFSVDVDAASYTNVRRFINNGQLPPADAVRVEEMINYFKYDLQGPNNGDPVAITTETSSAPWNPNHRLVRIGLKARTIDMSHLPPSNLVFLIDVSGSMDEPNKLPLVKAAMKMLTDQLRAQDRVAIVVYAGNAGLVLPSTTGDKKAEIYNAIDNLSAGGSTAGGAGLKLAYKIARENYRKDGNNRIILGTDGDFNVGDYSDGDMETLITRERESHVPLSILGFGMGNYKDSKMETLADKGNGNYAYIDNLTEARKTLIDEYGGTMFMVAKDVKLQVEFNPGKVQAYRLVGYEDRLLNKEDFNNDTKDAGDMGSGHTVTALYEIVPTGIADDYSTSVDPLKYQQPKNNPSIPYSDELMTVKFRYKQPGSDYSKMSVAVVKDRPASFNSTTADFRFASAVAEFGMLLRNSQFKQHATFDQAISIAQGAKGHDEGGYRSEFIRLAETAKSLANSASYTTTY